jgi:hypothetical protein
MSCVCSLTFICNLFQVTTSHFKEPGSSVSIVSDYVLDVRVIGVRSPVQAEDFSSSLCVQTSSEAHPAGVLSQGLKWGRGVTLTTHPHVAPR